MNHVNATCAGFIVGCITGAIVEVVFPSSGLQSAITLMLANGAVIGIATLVLSTITARRPPPPP